MGSYGLHDEIGSFSAQQRMRNKFPTFIMYKQNVLIKGYK